MSSAVPKKVVAAASPVRPVAVLRKLKQAQDLARAAPTVTSEAERELMVLQIQMLADVLDVLLSIDRRLAERGK